MESTRAELVPRKKFAFRSKSKTNSSKSKSAATPDVGTGREKEESETKTGVSMIGGGTDSGCASYGACEAPVHVVESVLREVECVRCVRWLRGCLSDVKRQIFLHCLVGL